MDLVEDNKPVRPPAFAETPRPTPLMEACLAPMADRCICRKPKKVRRAFCLDCYLRLTPAMQKALWQRAGHGFEEAYRAAKEWLLA
jgi:hypothetical protein